MGSHHLGDTSIPGSEVQESLGPPLWADLEQPLELLLREHKHRATAQKPETENTSYEDTLLIKQGAEMHLYY